MLAARDFANELRNDEAVRRADLYALIVEYLARVQKYEMAYKAIEQMKQRCPGAQVSPAQQMVSCSAAEPVTHGRQRSVRGLVDG